MEGDQIGLFGEDTPPVLDGNFEAGDRKVIERLHTRNGTDPCLGSLTACETQILALIAVGLTNREIGAELSLAEKTVPNYVSGLLTKLGLHRRTQAAILHLGSHPAANG